MPNEYPEHIDQLDHFYQQNLADIEILPPADMWDRISAAYAEGEKEKDKSGFLFNNRNKLIGIVAVTLFISASTYFYVANSNKPSPQQNSTTPIIDNETTQDSSSLYEQKTINAESKPSLKQNSDNSAKKRSMTNSQIEQNTSSNTIEYSDNKTIPSDEIIVNEPAIEMQSTEIDPEVIVEKPAKKKVSFKDKYKKEYQDSTRKLFVPDK